MRRFAPLLLFCVMLVGLLPVCTYAQTEESQFVEKVVKDESAEEETVSEEELAAWNSLKEAFSNISNVTSDAPEAAEPMENFWEQTKSVFEQYLQELLQLFD